MLKEETKWLLFGAGRILTGKMQKKAFWGTENVRHIDLGGGHLSVYMCKNSSRCKDLCTFLYVIYLFFLLSVPHTPNRLFIGGDKDLEENY